MLEKANNKKCCCCSSLVFAPFVTLEPDKNRENEFVVTRFNDLPSTYVVNIIFLFDMVAA